MGREIPVSGPSAAPFTSTVVGFSSINVGGFVFGGWECARVRFEYPVIKHQQRRKKKAIRCLCVVILLVARRYAHAGKMVYRGSVFESSYWHHVSVSQAFFSAWVRGWPVPATTPYPDTPCAR